MMLTFVVSIFASAGITNAQSDREINSYPFISAIPKNAAVGESVLINFGLLNNLGRVDDGWNVTAVITDPDGVVTRIDAMTWSTGTIGRSFVPTKEGDYKLVCTFDRVYYTSSSAALTGWYKASESDPFILTAAASGGKPSYPGHNLPAEYWTRPIDGQLREWYSISGSWVAIPIDRRAEYNDPVLSPHVLWTMPIGDSNGGMAGGEYMYQFQDGDAYEGKFTGLAMIAGILYYNKYASGMPTQAIVAVDVHTGEKLWERSYNFATSTITAAQLLSWDSYNNRGTWAYIWITNGTTMFALEAYTGDLVYTMTNVPSGTIYRGANGELLKYVYSNLGTTDNPNWHLRQWNSSYVVTYTGDPDVSWGSAVRGRTFNATERGFDIDIALPPPNDGGIFGSIIYAFPNDKVVIGSSGLAALSGGNLTLSAVSIKPRSIGNILYKNVVWNTPSSFGDIATESYQQSNWGAKSPELIVFWEKNTRIYYGFSLETGQYLWKTAPQSYESSWEGVTSGGGYYDGIIVYGKFLSANVAGIVYCYDIKTGETLWAYEATDKYQESYLSENWWAYLLFVVDGKVYVGHSEHSTLTPKPRGAPFFVLDVETGEVVWEIFGMFRMTHWGGPPIIGDSIIVTQDTYNSQIYAIGKGPSSVTVAVPNVGVTTNTPVLIQGTVMDNSPGAQTDKMKLRFPNGVPAVSDDSMGDWMLYVYKNFDKPIDTVGVPVTIGIVTPDGYDELYAVSDESGQFMVSYTPPVAGEYVVYAFFDGTDSYYGQWAQHGMVVAAATEQTTDNNNLMYGLYAIGIVIIILAVVLVVLGIKKK